jgi:hypothetical protein
MLIRFLANALMAPPVMGRLARERADDGFLSSGICRLDAVGHCDLVN